MSNALQSVNDLPEVSFIDNVSLKDIKSQLINDFVEMYNKITGNQAELPTSDINRMILYACAAQIYQAYQYVERAGRLNLLKYSYGDYLDNIGALKNVSRQQATRSKVTVRFKLSEKREAPVQIPSTTRVTTGNFDAYWELEEDKAIPPGAIYADFECVCTEIGEFSNGCQVGEITELVDPVPYIDSISNITVSAGGYETESDEDFAERILLAPSSYSVAGTEDAYIYHIKTHNASIIDVKIITDKDATVNIFFLLSGGNIPTSEDVANLQAYLDNAEDIRPLTDHIVVMSPTVVNYDINVTYYIDKSDKNQEVTIKSDISNAISEFIIEQSSEIGKDINTSILVQKIMNAGAKRVEVKSPVFTAINETSVAHNNPTKSITYGGLE